MANSENTANPPRMEEGSFVGSYRILRHINSGNSWDVYEAKSSSSHRQVALKIPCGWTLSVDTLQHLIEVDHPCIAKIYEIGSDRGTDFVAQELVVGPRGDAFTLAQELHNEGGKASEARVRVIAKQLFDALGYMGRFRIHGIGHSAISADKVILTGQRRAKLMDVGLLGEASGEMLEEQKAADIVQVGCLVYQMLTGTVYSADTPPPSSLGVDKVWDRVIADCVSAQPGNLPDMNAMRDLMITSVDPSRKGPLLLCAVILLLIALAAGGALAHRSHQKKLARQAAEKAAQEETAQEEKIRKFLDFAQGASARMNYDAARKAVEKVLEVAPDHVRARQLLADVQTAEGLARISNVKTRAEKAWGSIRDLDGGQGLQKRFEAVNERLVHARNAMAELNFDLAATHYKWIADEAEALLAADSERQKADEKRRLAETARDGADLANAAEFAADFWKSGGDLLAQAQEAFSNQKFQEAAEIWQRAEASYTEARRKADGYRRVRVAKSAYESSRTGAGETVTDAMSSTQRETIDALVAAAEEAMKVLDWDLAESRYDEARRALEEGIATGTVVLRKKHYTEAMRRAKQLIENKNFPLAEEAIEEALKVEGYQDDEIARKALALVRRAQVKTAGRVARYGKMGNMVINGDFSEGTGKEPLGWQKPDNLVVFWDKDELTGKAIRMDTDVYREEWEKHRLNPDEPVTKTQTSGTRYNTVGGTAGVALYSRPIPVDPGAYYLIEYDAKAIGGEPFLYVKGYWKCAEEDLKDQGEKIIFRPFPDGPEFSLTQMGTSGGVRRPPKPGDYIQCFRRRIVARFPEEMKWRHFKSVIYFDPKRHIEVVLLELYAFWPPGEYWFDNISMRQVSEQDFKDYNAERQRLGAEANFGTPVKGQK